MACNFLWALYYLINVNFDLSSCIDFDMFYIGGQQILLDPANLYKVQLGFVSLPSFATSLSFIVLLAPLSFAQYIFYTISIIAAILCVREFNKILILMNLDKKTYRFLFLIIISNGDILYMVFKYNQTKFIIALLLLFIIRREIQYKKNNKEKDLKFFLINYACFIYALGVYPIIILFFLVYLFHDITYSNIFKKINIKKYSIAMFMFAIQNFLFMIFPNLIFDYIDLFIVRSTSGGWVLFYTKEFIEQYPPYLMLVLLSILLFITFVLIIKKGLNIQERFGFLSLIFLFFSPFSPLYGPVVFLPFCLLLIVRNLNLDDIFLQFLKNNKIQLIGMLLISILYFRMSVRTIFTYFLFLETNPFIILVYLRYLFVLCIYSLLILLLYLKNKKSQR